MADWKRGLRGVIYPVYEARVLRRMPDNLPKHVGVMLDGNRRWARSVGRDSAHGHLAGAANIEPLLGWCDEVGIEVVTLWLLSTDNLNRPPEELSALLQIIEDAVESLAEQRRWRLHPVGALDLLPSSTAEKLKANVDFGWFTEFLATLHFPPSAAHECITEFENTNSPKIEKGIEPIDKSQ